MTRLAIVLLVAASVAGPARAQIGGESQGGGTDGLLWTAETAEARPATDDEAGEGQISFEREEEEEAAPWRGSEVIYHNEFGIHTLDPAADLTWNPYWAMSWGFKPRWWFDETWYVGARLDVSREITQADDRTYLGETWVHDLLLSAGASNFYTIPVVDIGLSADLILTTPTSKLSQARTMALGIGPGVRLNRVFDVSPVGELSVGYHVRFSSFLHRYTTAEIETPLIPSCTRSESGCDEFLNTGARNIQWRVQHGIDVTWEPLEWLAASIAFEHLVSWLYPIERVDPRISHEVEDDIDRRYSSAFDIEVIFTPWAPIQLGLGYSTLSPQLAPDSTYYNPFYNRYSTLYLDVSLEIEGLVGLLTGGGAED